MYQLSAIICHILNKHKPSALKAHGSAWWIGGSAGQGYAHSGVSGQLAGHLWVYFAALGCAHSDIGS